MMLFTESSLTLQKICILSLLIIYLYNTDVRLACSFRIFQNTLILALHQPSFSSGKMLLREVELVFGCLVFDFLQNSNVNLVVMRIHLISVFLTSLLLALQGSL